MTIGLDAMLQAVELPTGVAHLATGLTDMNGDALTLQKEFVLESIALLMTFVNLTVLLILLVMVLLSSGYKTMRVVL